MSHSTPKLRTRPQHPPIRSQRKPTRERRAGLNKTTGSCRSKLAKDCVVRESQGTSKRSQRNETHRKPASSGGPPSGLRPTASNQTPPITHFVGQPTGFTVTRVAMMTMLVRWWLPFGRRAMMLRWGNNVDEKPVRSQRAIPNTCRVGQVDKNPSSCRKSENFNATSTVGAE